MIITLNIEAGSIRVLTLKGKKIAQWGSAPLEPGIVRDGLVLQPEALGQAIQILFKKLGISKGKVIVGLTGRRSTFRILSLPKLKPEMLEEAILRVAKKEIPVPLEELYITWQPVGGKVAGKQEYFVLGVPRELVDAEIQALDEAGIKPSAMHLKPLALARAVNRRDALIVHMEPDGFVITLVAEGIPAIVRVIAPKGGEATLEDNTRRLLDELSRTVQFYNRGHAENPLKPDLPAFLTGELSENAAATALLRAEIGYPVESLVPPLQHDPTLPIGSYAVNIGLALPGKRRRWQREESAAGYLRNIQPDILKGKYKPRLWPIKYLFLFLALMIAIAGLLPAFQAKNDAVDKTARMKTEMNTINSVLRMSKLVMGAEQNIADINAQADALEKSNQSILPSEGEAARTIRLATDLLPPPGYFTSVVLGADKIILNGVADSPSVAIAYALDLERKGYFADVSITELGETTFTILISRKTSDNSSLPTDQIGGNP